MEERNSELETRLDDTRRTAKKEALEMKAQLDKSKREAEAQSLQLETKLAEAWRSVDELKAKAMTVSGMPHIEVAVG